MRELTADLFISLDGFASGVDQPPYFGYFGPDLGKWVREHLDQPQIIVMGRATYQALAQFSAAATDEVSARMRELPKLVFSSTLQGPLIWKNTHLNNGIAAHEIAALKQQDGDPLRSIGSISLVRSMFKAGVVDRLRLMVFPVILGASGREPIYPDFPQTGLELMQTRVLDSAVILLEYRPALNRSGSGVSLPLK
jgi:dihydrofolate reductase